MLKELSIKRKSLILTATTSLITLSSLSLYGESKTPKSESCIESPHPEVVTLRHKEARGIGYEKGYSTVEGFFIFPKSLTTHWIPFLDLRAHLFNDGKPAANGGLGLRYKTDSRIWGANLYYDYRKTSWKHYNQISFGLETLGEIFDAHLTGYLPLGKRESSYEDPSFNKFEGTSLYLSRKREVAFRAVDAELGAHLGKIDFATFYAALGPYYLNFHQENGWGGQLRIAADLTEYTRLEAFTSYDSIFKGRVQGEFSIRIPFGPRKKHKKTKDSACPAISWMESRILQRVDRHEIIPTKVESKTSLAIDPVSQTPYQFLFVDNTTPIISENAETLIPGTYEVPFGTLSDAAADSTAGSIFYLFPGDGTMTGMDQGITLLARQQLLGSGVSHTLSTTVGSITIPEQSIGMPLIGNTGGDVVVISDGNTISGVYIQNTAGSAITYNTDIGSFTDITLSRNILQQLSGSSLSGAILSNGYGTVIVENNIINQESQTLALGGSNLSDGFYRIRGNTLQTGGASILLIDSSNIEMEIDENIALSTTTAFSFSINNTDTFLPHVVAFRDNYISTTGFAVQFTTENNSQYNLLIANNEIIASNAALQISHLDSSNLDAKIMNNTLGGGLQISNASASTTNLLVENNTIYGNTYALEVALTDSTSANCEIRNNKISATGIGISTSADTSETHLTLSILKNEFVSTNGKSLSLDNSGGTNIWSIENNRFLANSGALSGTTSAGTTCLRLISNAALPIGDAYSLIQLGGTFNLETPFGNLGTIVETGTITPVEPGSCSAQ